MRTLFSAESLGISEYAANRDLEFSYTAHPEAFKDEFRQKIDQSVPLNILVDNLKRYLHLVSDRYEDVQLLFRALRQFQTKREQWIKKSTVDIKKDYLFGPITMRALSYHKLPQFALEVDAHGRERKLLVLLKSCCLF